ncbi:hypothetical protein ACFQYP_57760 [Nonomuraea antimicrobica]
MSSNEPPVAKKIPTERTHHGDIVIDEYAWLSNKDDPDTTAYLTAENDFLKQQTDHLSELQEQVFQEIKGRTQETDLSVASRKGAWWYFARTEEGKQYAVSCRVPAGDDAPPEITPANRSTTNRSSSTATSSPATARSSRSAPAPFLPTARCWPIRPISRVTSVSR